MIEVVPHSRWNMQTIVALVSIAGVLAAGGATLSSLHRDTDRNSAGVERLTLGLEKNDSATAQLELRVERVEEIAADAAKMRRELDATLSRIHADLAVIKAMLEKKVATP